MRDQISVLLVNLDSRELFGPYFISTAFGLLFTCFTWFFGPYVFIFQQSQCSVLSFLFLGVSTLAIVENLFFTAQHLNPFLFCREIPPPNGVEPCPTREPEHVTYSLCHPILNLCDLSCQSHTSTSGKRGAQKPVWWWKIVEGTAPPIS